MADRTWASLKSSESLLDIGKFKVYSNIEVNFMHVHVIPVNKGRAAS